MRNLAVFASSCGPDNLNRSWETAKKILTDPKTNLDLDTPYLAEFGTKQWNLFEKGGLSGHRAVIIKVKQGNDKKDIAFKLELEIDCKNEQRPYITGNFSCPASGCSLKTESFTELANHHLTNHRTAQGDNIRHQCCGHTFYIFESYSAHVYEKHQNINSVTLQFEKVIPEKFDKYLDKESVNFFSVYQKRVTFRQLLQSGLTIMENFGSYFIFFWNCQDFAAWYLCFNGIPLSVIEPTIPDRVTGSGTSAR